jgi:DMSO reductase anchor subunit
MKDMIKDFFEGFFISVTLINLAMFILGLLFRPDQRFGYEVFIYPLIYGLIGMIPILVVRTQKELSVKQIIIRKIMQLFLLMVLLLGCIFGQSLKDPNRIPAIIGVAFSIVLIYVLVNVIEWMMDERAAKDMTEDLLKFQKRLEN